MCVSPLGTDRDASRSRKITQFRLDLFPSVSPERGQPEPRDISWGISSVGNTELPQFRLTRFCPLDDIRKHGYQEITHQREYQVTIGVPERRGTI